MDTTGVRIGIFSQLHPTAISSTGTTKRHWSNDFLHHNTEE